MFIQLAKGEIKQDDVRDFAVHTTDGNHIILLGSKTELITLELKACKSPNIPFPYVFGTYELPTPEMALNRLVKSVDLAPIYANSNVLEQQQLILDPTYIATHSPDPPAPTLMAASWAPLSINNRQMQIGLLNSYGDFTLITKTPLESHWRRLKALYLVDILQDAALPAFADKPTNITSFKQYKAYIDRYWITAFTWLTTDTAASDEHKLLLATATGNLITLTMDVEMQSVRSYRQFHSTLGRICYMRSFEHLLLIGSISGMVHLYAITDDNDDGFQLVKSLWTKQDRMGIQGAEITYSKKTDSYYIVFCKASTLLACRMPRSSNENPMEARINIGGMKITGFCSLSYDRYLVTTALRQLYSIHIGNDMSMKKNAINIGDYEPYQLLGLCTSRHKNLVNLLACHSSLHVISNNLTRTTSWFVVGMLPENNILDRCISVENSHKTMSEYLDLLAGLRLDIINQQNVKTYADFEPLKYFVIDDPASVEQQQRMQLKYHILDTQIHLQQNNLHYRGQIEPTKQEMEYLLVILAHIHMCLRVQYLCTLEELTPFQRKAVQCMLTENMRLRNKLAQSCNEKHPNRDSLKKCIAQMEIRSEELQIKLGITMKSPVDETEQSTRCNVSHVKVLPSLDQRYCSICGRIAIVDEAKLTQLYSPGSVIACPLCCGSYIVDLIDCLKTPL